MKILVLTKPYMGGAKIQLIVDKIVAYHEEYGYTAVALLDGHTYYVRESADFITRQLMDANASSDTVFNRKEHK